MIFFVLYLFISIICCSFINCFIFGIITLRSITIEIHFLKIWNFYYKLLQFSYSWLCIIIKKLLCWLNLVNFNFIRTAFFFILFHNVIFYENTNKIHKIWNFFLIRKIIFCIGTFINYFIHFIIIWLINNIFFSLTEIIYISF